MVDAARSDSPGESDEFPLLGAVMRSDVQEAERLLAAGADPNIGLPLYEKGLSQLRQTHPAIPAIGLTPLSLAAAKGNTEMVETLLRAKADPNGMTISGTAMAFAAAGVTAR